MCRFLQMAQERDMLLRKLQEKSVAAEAERLEAEQRAAEVASNLAAVAAQEAEARLQSERAEMEGRVRAAELAAQEAQALLERQRTEWQAAAAAKEAEVVVVESAELQESLETMRGEVQTLTVQLSEANTRIFDLEALVADRDVKLRDFEVMSGRVQELEMLNERLAAEFVKAEETIRELEKAVAEVEVYPAPPTPARAAVSGAAVSTLEQEVQSLKKEIEQFIEAEDASNEDDLLVELDALREQLSSANGKLASMQSELVGISDVATMLEMTQSELRRNRDKLDSGREQLSRDDIDAINDIMDVMWNKSDMLVEKLKQHSSKREAYQADATGVSPTRSSIIQSLSTPQQQQSQQNGVSKELQEALLKLSELTQQLDSQQLLNQRYKELLISATSTSPSPASVATPPGAKDSKMPMDIDLLAGTRSLNAELMAAEMSSSAAVPSMRTSHRPVRKGANALSGDAASSLLASSSSEPQSKAHVSTGELLDDAGRILHIQMQEAVIKALQRELDLVRDQIYEQQNDTALQQLKKENGQLLVDLKSKDDSNRRFEREVVRLEVELSNTQAERDDLKVLLGKLRVPHQTSSSFTYGVAESFGGSAFDSRSQSSRRRASGGMSGSFAVFDDDNSSVAMSSVSQGEDDSSLRARLSEWMIGSAGIVPSRARMYAAQLVESGIGSIARLKKKVARDGSFLRGICVDGEDAAELWESLNEPGAAEGGGGLRTQDLAFMERESAAPNISDRSDELSVTGSSSPDRESRASKLQRLQQQAARASQEAAMASESAKQVMQAPMGKLTGSRSQFAVSPGASPVTSSFLHATMGGGGGGAAYGHDSVPRSAASTPPGARKFITPKPTSN